MEKGIGKHELSKKERDIIKEYFKVSGVDHLKHDDIKKVIFNSTKVKHKRRSL